MEKLRILGFARSLRVGSYNRALLRAATDLLPDGTTLEIFDLNGIPPFNQDLEMNMPAKVKEFKSKIREADAILIATPEYNYSVPGVLKNAIDSASDHMEIIHSTTNQLQSLVHPLECLEEQEHSTICVRRSYS
ncbi:MAG: NAD(P)H-dependent oxidoreductase [Candidatus Nitrosopolaris sp.]